MIQGEPKAITWTKIGPIRCATDSMAHCYVCSGDTYCWPTNLGWFMGSIVIYSSFLTGITLALYHGSSWVFGKLIQDAKVALLCTIPSLVKTWKITGCVK